MPTTADLVAGTVMDTAASLMNDRAKSTYTYDVQIPYLNVALRELKELFELNEVPVVDTTSAAIDIPEGVEAIGFEPDMPVVDTPYLPNDLIEPTMLWEREYEVNPYIPMTKVDVLPLYMEGVEISQFQFYVWNSQEIRVLPANQINQIKMNYIRDIFPTVTDEDDALNVVNAQTFLEFRTGALLAEFVAENKTRAADLNNFAGLGLDRVVGIGTKGRQAIMTRHRPFRAGYKRRTYQ